MRNLAMNRLFALLTLTSMLQAIFSTLMDFRVTVPQRVEACCSVLLKLCSNVLQHPADDKYRQVRALLP